jgi:hypothetical protein
LGFPADFISKSETGTVNQSSFCGAAGQGLLEKGGTKRTQRKAGCFNLLLSGKRKGRFGELFIMIYLSVVEWGNPLLINKWKKDTCRIRIHF